MPARLPERPFSPNRALINLMGMAGGLAIGLLLVAFLEYRDTTFRVDDEVVSVLSLPVLAVVPLMLAEREQNLARKEALCQQAEALVDGFVELWTKDSRPFSAYYADVLRRGREDLTGRRRWGRSHGPRDGRCRRRVDRRRRDLDWLRAARCRIVAAIHEVDDRARPSGSRAGRASRRARPCAFDARLIAIIANGFRGGASPAVVGCSPRRVCLRRPDWPRSNSRFSLARDAGARRRRRDREVRRRRQRGHRAHAP